MATKLIANGIQPQSTDVTILFTAENSNGVRVSAFVVSNNTATTAHCDIYIVGGKGGSSEPDATNRILRTPDIASDECYCPAELINQVIPAAGSLRVQVSAGNTLTFRASGVEC